MNLYLSMDLSKTFLKVVLLIQAKRFVLFKRADVFVLPQFYNSEGRSGILIKAMTAGLPFIPCKHAGIPGMVFDGVNDYLGEPYLPEQIAKNKIFLVIKNL